MSAKKYELVSLDSGKKSTLEAHAGTLGPECLGIGNLELHRGCATPGTLLCS